MTWLFVSAGEIDFGSILPIQLGFEIGWSGSKYSAFQFIECRLTAYECSGDKINDFPYRIFNFRSYHRPLGSKSRRAFWG
jgi:hypothetical protein